MHDRTKSKILVVLIMSSMFSAAIISLTPFTVFAQPATLEDVIAEIDAVNDRLDDVQSQLHSISASTPTTTELAILDSALDELSDDVDNLKSDLASLNATAATKSDVAASIATVDELRTALDEVRASLSSLSKTAVTPSDLDAATSDLSKDLESLRTLVNIAIVLALIAPIASIIAVYFILKKRAK
jgi:chromosome segregation ATPase